MSETDAKERPQQGSTLPLIAMILLTFWMCKRPADPQAGFKQCGDHLHQIGVVLEKYRLASDDKLYPKTLDDAYKGKTLPVCTVNGKTSYKLGYKPSAGLRSYVLVCKGEGHKTAGVPSDYPRIAFGPAENSPPSEESSPSPASATPSPQAIQSPVQAPPSPVGKASPILKPQESATPNTK